MRRAVMICLTGCLVAVAALTTGCGEKPDELGPYVEAYQAMDTYHQQLMQMEVNLKADQAAMAAGTAGIIEQYIAALDKIEVEDKAIRAGHNSVKRSLEHALKKIVEPDFPTFIPSALKQIDLVREAVTLHMNHLEKMWQDEERPGEFPLAWPSDS